MMDRVKEVTGTNRMRPHGSGEDFSFFTLNETEPWEGRSAE